MLIQMEHILLDLCFESSKNISGLKIKKKVAIA